MEHSIYTQALSRKTVWTLENYSKLRQDFRKVVMAHKKNRTVFLGEHLNLLFEDTMTVRYQVQEMLRIEKIFEESGIQDELSAYMPLLPTGKNLKATMMIEYPVVDERRQALKRLRGIERQVYIQINGGIKIYAIADEDLSRETDEKTSAVHFMRFELSQNDIDRVKQGAALTVGVDHEQYKQAIELIGDTRNSLVSDLN
ncbi:MAG: hypothetical protein RL344_1084 [Pseudomonadota bacterium]|jgi:hypothetical protein